MKNCRHCEMVDAIIETRNRGDKTFPITEALPEHADGCPFRPPEFSITSTVASVRCATCGFPFYECRRGHRGLCGQCDGKGWLVILSSPPADGLPEVSQRVRKCPECGGSGKEPGAGKGKGE